MHTIVFWIGDSDQTFLRAAQKPNGASACLLSGVVPICLFLKLITWHRFDLVFQYIAHPLAAGLDGVGAV